MVVVKCCSGCGVVKSLDDFHRDRTKSHGRASRCKECESEYKRRRYEENCDKELERRRRYYEENRDKVLESQRRYYKENRDKIAEYNHRRYDENRDKVIARSRRYREENRDKVLERQRRRYEENRDKVLESRRRHREENREYVNRQKSRGRRRLQSATESAAIKHGTWSEAEVAILMADDGRTLVAKALELGRTYESCDGKRKRLRRTGATN